MGYALHDFSRHHTWATGQLLAFCEDLDDATLDATCRAPTAPSARRCATSSPARARTSSGSPATRSIRACAGRPSMFRCGEDWRLTPQHSFHYIQLQGPPPLPQYRGDLAHI